MKIFQSRKLTDAEFVEKIRKQTLSAKRRAWILLAFSFFYLGLIVFLWHLAAKYEWFQTGFLVGCFVGVFIGFLLMKALMYFVFFLEHLFGYRKEKLLIAYYDQLHSANK
jgi:fatty acid desaturase